MVKEEMKGIILAKILILLNEIILINDLLNVKKLRMHIISSRIDI